MLTVHKNTIIVNIPVAAAIAAAAVYAIGVLPD